MNVQQQHPPAGRVVFFTRDRTLAVREPSSPAARRAVYVPTAYEAAAELLAGGVVALVIDLRALSPAHLRLIDIARQSGAALLATGVPRLPVIAQALSGAMIVQRGELPAAVERAFAAPPGETSAPAVAAGRSLIEIALAGPEGKPLDLSAAAWDAPPPVEPASAEPAAASTAPPVTERPAQPPAPPQGVYESDRSPEDKGAALLTQAELAALLEGPQ